MKRARSTRPTDCPFVTKGGLKLAFALERFGVDPRGLTVADLGCHRGGFTDCLLSREAAHVYAVDTAYGILDWKLRNDARVTVHERANLIHWQAPEPIDLAVIDAGWTPQRLSVPAALRNIKPGGRVLSLLKPSYEADKALLVRGVLPQRLLADVVAQVTAGLRKWAVVRGEAVSPFPGSGGNTDVWLDIMPFSA